MTGETRPTGDPRRVVVMVEPAPAGDAGVVIVHDPLEALNVIIGQVLDLLVVGVLERKLELLLQEAEGDNEWRSD